MKSKTLIKAILIIGIILGVMLILMPLIFQPIVKTKIERALNSNGNVKVQIGKVKLLFVPAYLELQNIVISPASGNTSDLQGNIESVKLTGIKLFKILFRKDYDVNEVNISNAHLMGEYPKKKNSNSGSVLHSKVHIGEIKLNNINLKLKDVEHLKSLSVTEGNLRFKHVNIAKEDTLSSKLINQISFETKELSLVSADSFYTYTAEGINYDGTAAKLSVSHFIIHPNFPDYEFAARHKYQTDHIEANTNNIRLYHFSIDTFLKSKKLLISYIEVDKAEVRVFRDRRKEFKHEKKPSFQEMISSFPNTLHIDSIRILNSNVAYLEHVEKAKEPGEMDFINANARIYNITNDKRSKSKNSALELYSSAWLMGKGKITTFMKAQLFDPSNSFSMRGRLLGMDLKELNPVTEKNAFISLSSGRIDSLNFSFVADDTKATGNMIFCYHGLNLTFKNKRTNDTTALKEQVLSFIANAGVLDSNPKPGEQVREGIIDYKRDPERFVFNYCARALLTGIKSSTQKSGKTLLKKLFGKKG